MQILRAFELVRGILVPVFPQWISAHICIPLMSQYVHAEAIRGTCCIPTYLAQCYVSCYEAQSSGYQLLSCYFSCMNAEKMCLFFLFCS
jgi:hypothetical protein